MVVVGVGEDERIHGTLEQRFCASVQVAAGSQGVKSIHHQGAVTQVDDPGVGVGCPSRFVDAGEHAVVERLDGEMFGFWKLSKGHDPSPL